MKVVSLKSNTLTASERGLEEWENGRKGEGSGFGTKDFAGSTRVPGRVGP